MTSDSSSSGFIVPTEYSADWRDVTLVQERSHAAIYTAVRYGRRFVLKGIPADKMGLTDYLLQQEQEFRLGVSLVHPNIAATYGMETIEGIGRCIVQEWIDGLTLGQWLATRPKAEARRRVFDQLLDAIEYIHDHQLVHHDLKNDNILITRHGTNVKLIDFGLSATDDQASPIANDPQVDMQALGRLMPALMPWYLCPIAHRLARGRYTNIAALRRALRRFERIIRTLPIALSIVLLTVSGWLFYTAHQERLNEQQRYEAMQATVEQHVQTECAHLQEIVDRCEVYHRNNSEEMAAFMACMEEYSAYHYHLYAVRDSLVATYPENDPLREQAWQLWVRRTTEINNDLYQQLVAKLQ